MHFSELNRYYACEIKANLESTKNAEHDACEQFEKPFCSPVFPSVT